MTAARRSGPSDDQPAAEGEGYAPLWAAGGRYFTVTEPSFDTFSDPAVCYADLETCSGAASSDVASIHASADGDTWTVVDTSDLGAGDELIGIVGSGDGRVSMAHVVKRGLVVSSWPAGVDLPEGQPRTRRSESTWSPFPKVRTRSQASATTRRCTSTAAWTGSTWVTRRGSARTVVRDVETGAGDDVPGGWPMAGQTIYGFATLTPAGVVEYSVGEGDGAEVIATYEKTGVQPPGCD